MYCSKCGQFLSDNTTVCPYCGEALQDNNYFNQQPNQQFAQPQPNQQYNQYNQYNQPYQPMGKNWIEEISTSKTLGLIAIIIGFFIPIAAWICGGIGLSKANSVPDLPQFAVEKRKARKMNIWGIIIPFIVSLIAIVIYLIVFGVFLGMASYY